MFHKIRDPAGQVEDSITWCQCCQDEMVNSIEQNHNGCAENSERRRAEGAEERQWF